MAEPIISRTQKQSPVPFPDMVVVMPRKEAEALAEAIACLHRGIAKVSAVLIDRLDMSDPDPDLESVGAEDDFEIPFDRLRFTSGPGCPISDPGGGNVEDEGEREEATL